MPAGETDRAGLLYFGCVGWRRDGGRNFSGHRRYKKGNTKRANTTKEEKGVTFAQKIII